MAGRTLKVDSIHYVGELAFVAYVGILTGETARHGSGTGGTGSAIEVVAGLTTETAWATALSAL